MPAHDHAVTTSPRHSPRPPSSNGERLSRQARRQLCTARLVSGAHFATCITPAPRRQPHHPALRHGPRKPRPHAAHAVAAYFSGMSAG